MVRYRVFYRYSSFGPYNNHISGKTYILCRNLDIWDTGYYKVRPFADEFSFPTKCIARIEAKRNFDRATGGIKKGWWIDVKRYYEGLT